MSEIHDPYDDQLRAAKYRAERDLARDQLERANRKICELEAEAIERRTVRAEDREAVEWVRGHGGLYAVKNLHDSGELPLCDLCNILGLDRVNTSWMDAFKELEKRLMPAGYEWDDRLAGAVEFYETMHDLLYTVDCEEDHDGPEMVKEVMRRLMPGGMEWPRFEDGEPVRIGDEYECWCGDTKVVCSVTLREGCSVLNESHLHSFVVSDGPFTAHGERVKRPAPKVLDADGVEIEVGDDLYSVEGGLKFHVGFIDTRNGKIATAEMFAIDKWADPSLFTHRSPVLAADGKPLREGEMVYSTESGAEFTVIGIAKSGDVHIRWGYDFEDKTGTIAAELLTHELPDSWERLIEDAQKDRCEYFGFAGMSCDKCPACEGDYYDIDCDGDAMARDLERRAKALAERGSDGDRVGSDARAADEADPEAAEADSEGRGFEPGVRGMP